MLWLFTSNKRTRVAPGGQKMRSDCPECRQPRDFVEVEVETSAGVWFIDVLSDTERLWRCTGCGENFELRDKSARAEPSPPSAPPPRPARDMRAELERERARREAETRRRERQVDDELAALKKKLGK
jgi:hypothetical protein